MTRRAAIAKVQIARKDLGLEEDDYRALLERVTGRRSAADLDDAQLGRVLDELKARGWTPKIVQGGRRAEHSPRSSPATSPIARKARAMWISLYQLGEVRDPSERALEAFGRRQLGVDRLHWANQSHGHRLIEALKAMAERAGWDQSLDGVPPELHLAVLKDRLAAAIARKAAG